MSLGLFAALSGAASAEGLGPHPLDMYGGTPVAATDVLESTTVALLFYTGQGMMGLCSGSILADDLILTAAHCLEGSNPVIVFGNDINNAVAEVRSDNMLTPRDYQSDTRKNNRHDIGLVHFTGGLPAGFQKVKLLENPSALHFLKKVTVAGFGSNQVKPGKKRKSGTLKTGVFRILSAHRSRTEVTLHQKLRSAICPGDSGGPAFVKKDGEYYLWGVTNLIGGLVTPISPCMGTAVYADIATPELREWIEKASVEVRRGY